MFNSGGCLTCWIYSCSCYLNIKESISLVWPIHNRDWGTCSFLDFLKAGFHSPSIVFIRKSLLCVFIPMLLPFCIKLFIFGFKPVYGILSWLGATYLKPNLAAKLAFFSFHFIFCFQLKLCHNKIKNTKKSHILKNVNMLQKWKKATVILCIILYEMKISPMGRILNCLNCPIFYYSNKHRHMFLW